MNRHRHVVRTCAVLALLAAAAMAAPPALAAELERPPTLAASDTSLRHDAAPRAGLSHSRFFTHTLPSAFLPGFDKSAVVQLMQSKGPGKYEAIERLGPLGMRDEQVFAPSGPVDASNNLLKLEF